MPVRESALQKLFDEAMSEDYRIGGNINSFIYEVTTVSQEDIDGVRYLIDHAKGGSAAGNAVSRIIEEEAGAYFAGQKSVDDVTALIQNRVQLFVDENR